MDPSDYFRSVKIQYRKTLNSDNDEFCKGCGASKADSEKNYFEIQEEKRRKALEAAQAAHPQAPTRTRSGKKWIFFGILAALLIFFLILREPLAISLPR